MSGKKKKKNNRKKLIFALFFIAVVVLFVIIYAVPHVSGVLTKTYTAEYGTLKVTDDVTCYLVRNEKVYYASRSGNLGYYIGQGEMVRSGTKVLDITGSAKSAETSKFSDLLQTVQRYTGGESLFSDDIKKLEAAAAALQEQLAAAEKSKETALIADLTKQIQKLDAKRQYISAADDQAKQEVVARNQTLENEGNIPNTYLAEYSGIVSYFIDGYETEFTPENMRLLDRSKVEKLDIKEQNICRDTTLHYEPLYKVVDNSVWYAVLWADQGDIVKYEKDRSVTLDLPTGSVKGTVEDIVESDDSWLIILKFNRYFEDLDKIRKVDGTVVTSDYKGLIISNKSLLNKDGQIGVYIKNSKTGEYVFTPVKTVNSDGEYTLIESGYYFEDEDKGGQKVLTVDIYDEILRDGSSVSAREKRAVKEE